MNNIKSCVPCVCTGSGRKRVCEEHNNSMENTMIPGPRPDEGVGRVGTVPHFQPKNPEKWASLS